MAQDWFQQETGMRATALVLGLVAAAVAFPARAVVLTFDGDICDLSTTNACANGREVLQSYGDQAGALDVIYYRNGPELGPDPLSSGARSTAVSRTSLTGPAWVRWEPRRSSSVRRPATP